VVDLAHACDRAWLIRQAALEADAGLSDDLGDGGDGGLRPEAGLEF